MVWIYQIPVVPQMKSTPLKSVTLHTTFFPSVLIICMIISCYNVNMTPDILYWITVSLVGGLSHFLFIITGFVYIADMP
jgi:hypothetical protein